MKRKKLIIILSIIIVILLIILIILNSILKKKKNQEEIQNIVNSYTSIEEFKTIEEVAIYLGCEYKKQEISNDQNFNVDIYMKIKILPYTDGKSNEGFYKKLIAYSASVLNYQNFRIIDKSNNLTIEVMCDKDNKLIEEYYINGEDNYFSKNDSKKQLKEVGSEGNNITKLNIQSKIITDLIKNKWSSNGLNFGTKESSFNNYDIFHDEGIRVKEIDGKIYNIIFTEKYKDKIANNITTNMTKDQIIKSLGNPTFSDEAYDFIGYKSEDIYLFYNSKKEISIYRIEKNYNSDEFAKIVDSYIENGDTDKMIEDIKEKYTDYDKFEVYNNELELQYTLKGFSIRFKAGLSKGIQIYNNYSGKIYSNLKVEDLINKDDLPNNINFYNEDLVKKAELIRIQERENAIFSCIDEKSKKQDLSQSNKYYLNKKILEDGSYKIQFIASNSNYIDSELRECVNYYIWMDDDNFIYSIENRGIYLYNATSRKYTTLITGNEEKFEIKEYKNNILKYDEKMVKIKK